jgi:hypothetical protein
VLTARLRKLEQAGVIERRLYREHPPRYEYLLTDAGRELQPILLALKEWGDHHCNPGAEPVVFQHTCGADFHPLTVCAACRGPLRDGDLTVTRGHPPRPGDHVTLAQMNECCRSQRMATAPQTGGR